MDVVKCEAGFEPHTLKCFGHTCYSGWPQTDMSPHKHWANTVYRTQTQHFSCCVSAAVPWQLLQQRVLLKANIGKRVLPVLLTSRAMVAERTGCQYSYSLSHMPHLVKQNNDFDKLTFVTVSTCPLVSGCDPSPCGTSLLLSDVLFYDNIQVNQLCLKI